MMKKTATATKRKRQEPEEQGLIRLLDEFVALFFSETLILQDPAYPGNEVKG